jgi:hypothetical protein
MILLNIFMSTNIQIKETQMRMSCVGLPSPVETVRIYFVNDMTGFHRVIQLTHHSDDWKIDNYNSRDNKKEFDALIRHYIRGCRMAQQNGGFHIERSVSTEGLRLMAHSKL